MKGRVLRLVSDALSRRRYNCHHQGDASWDERALVAVRLARDITDGDDGAIRVADLGCGNERLRHLLEQEFGARVRYRGYDLHPQQPSTERLDVTRDALPTADLTFVLGVVEYLDDPQRFLENLRRASPLSIISYSVADNPEPLSPAERRARGWRHDHTSESLRDLLREAGFSIHDSTRVSRGRTEVWACRAATAA